MNDLEAEGCAPKTKYHEKEIAGLKQHNSES